MSLERIIRDASRTVAVSIIVTGSDDMMSPTVRDASSLRDAAPRRVAVIPPVRVDERAVRVRLALVVAPPRERVVAVPRDLVAAVPRDLDVVLRARGVERFAVALRRVVLARVVVFFPVVRARAIATSSAGCRTGPLPGPPGTETGAQKGAKYRW
jgi:hypothetical protein